MASRFLSPTFDAGPGIKPASGAKLSFLETGDSTPKDTFTTAAADIANANPVIADSNGVFPDIFISGTYKVILTNKNDVQVGFGEKDPVTSEGSENFDTVAALKLSNLSAVTLAKTIDYSSTQRGGGAPYLIKTAAQATTDGDVIDGDGNHTLANGNVAIFQPGPVVKASQFGLLGDASDETTRFASYLTFCSDKIADFESLPFLISSTVSVSVGSIVIINADSVKVFGVPASRAESFLRFACSGNFTLTGGITIDCENKFAKGLFVVTSNAEAIVTIDSPVVSNCQTDGAVNALTAGVIQTGLAKTVIINDPVVTGIDATPQPTLAARGVMCGIDNNTFAENIIINNPRITTVTPSNEGDGIFCLTNAAGDTQNVEINNPVFTDCAKRAVKTQSSQTIIRNPIVRRDNVFAETITGQVELDIQFGNGTIINPVYSYVSATAYPASGLASLNPERAAGATARGSRVIGGSCTFDDPTDKTVADIFRLQSFADTDVNNDSLIKDFTFNGIVSKSAVLLRPVASATVSFKAIKNLVIDNLKVEDVTGDANAAFIFANRSGTGHADSEDTSVIDCVVSTATADVDLFFEEQTNVTPTFKATVNNFRVKDLAPFRFEQTLQKSVAVAENGTSSIIATLTSNSSMRFTYIFASAGNLPMHVDGIVTVGDSGAEGVVTDFHADKSAIGAGAIDVTVALVSSVWEVTFAKTAGGNTAAGNVQIVIEAAGKSDFK